MIDRVDSDTGEVRSISEAAIHAGHEREVAEEVARLGIGRDRLYAALMTAVGKMPAWITTDKAGAREIKYATLKHIIETVRPFLHEQGLRLRQGADRSWPLDEGAGIKGRLIPIYTDIIHAESGEVDRTIVEIPLSKMDPQAMGSAITYGRRYSLLAALGLATDEADDDGETAKAKGLTDRDVRSPELVALIREMDAFKLASDLAEWGHDARQTKRLGRLIETERAVAKTYYDERARGLLDAPAEDPTDKPKGRKS